MSRKEVTMTDLKELGNLERDAAAFLGVYKDTPKGNAPKPYDPTEAAITIGGVPLYINQQEENKMTLKTTMTRRTVTVELYDDDKGLPVEDSLVCRCKDVVTEDNDEVTIREVLMSGKIKDYLDKHNTKRTKIVNEEILNRTGQEVFLRPVKLKDLRWVVK